MSSSKPASTSTRKKSLWKATITLIFASCTNAAPIRSVPYGVNYDFTLGPRLSTGAKIGIAFGTLALLILLLVTWALWKNHRLRKQEAAAMRAAAAKASRMAQCRPPQPYRTAAAPSETTLTTLKAPEPVYHALSTNKE
ncbi:hypothetical protein BGW41_002946 [Actinomortierella wolfii]|nr:hypothetical protein BGW41_002946 [Actinomortierella wolfii]